MAEIIVGTAGHVDHGKTELIRALTGQDTDRLPEEKRRGISIDLGFAEFVLPSGRRAGVVYVPGHERFVRNMVAGATGMDLVLLVVAADEGVMPQTREHLDILHLLGTQCGVIVLTKVDLVDPDWLDLVEDEVRDAVRGTFLEDAPVVRVSSRTGVGLDRLRATVDDLIPRLRPRPFDSFVRLPIDRVFTVAGFGTVVTGTLASGTLREEDRLELLPGGAELRVRQLQVHGRRVERAVAGQRVAVNLAGGGGAPVERGHVLTTPGTLQPATELAAWMQLLPGAGATLRSGSRLRLHAGTSEVIGRVLVLDGDALEPGGRGYVLFRTERPLVAARGDRYIVRTYSPMHTIGGGQVLDAGRRYRRKRSEDLARLRLLEGSDPAAIVLAELDAAGVPLPEGELARRLLLTRDGFAPLVGRLAREGRLVRLDDGLLSAPGVLDRLRDRCLELVSDYHRREPLRPGMPREELRTALRPPPDPRAFAALLSRLQGEGSLALAGDHVRLPRFEPRARGEVAEQIERLVALYRDAGLTPPSLAEVVGRLGLPADRLAGLLDHLVGRGDLVRLDADLYLAREIYEQAVGAVVRRIADGGAATVADLRDLLGTTRKYVVPLLEGMDRQNLTRRSGERRVLTPRGEQLARSLTPDPRPAVSPPDPRGGR